MDNPRKTVALIGGSFNPMHNGHMESGCYAHEALHVDETWFLFSINPDKDPKKYESLEHRMNMADILLQDSKTKIILSDLEDKIAQKKGRHETYYILQDLQESFPDYKFIWVMGADSFASFHTWTERDAIMKDHLIAVVDRPGYTIPALSSPTARDYSDQIIDINNLVQLEKANSGWCFLDSPKIDVSSSDIMQKLTEGKMDFAAPFNKVADYIYAHGLYGTKSSKQTLLPQ